MRWIIVLVWCACIWTMPGRLYAEEWSRRDHAIGISGPFHSSRIPREADTTPGSIAQLNLRLSTGPRRDALIWSTAGTLQGRHPNILSELSWTDVHSQQWAMDGNGTIDSRIYFRGALGYAAISSGVLMDSDYDGDDRTFEYSRSRSRTNGDGMWDATLGSGPSFSPGGGNFKVAPLFGYAVRLQNLRITDGWQVLSSPPRTPAEGPLDPRLNSLYRSRWAGPWLGLDLISRFPNSGSRKPDRGSFRNKNSSAPAVDSGLAAQSAQTVSEFVIGMEYHFMLDFSAAADWNLRGDLQHPVSFRHYAGGDGVLLRGEWLVRLHRSLLFSASMSYLHFSAEQGISRMYTRDGSVRETRLNPAEWESTSFLFGVGYSF